ncbi:MAG: type IV secretion system protein [Xanthomonadaceae bacterium]|jgi:type IV secretion system protein VirB8|nr:type IV secretion system protein [Xanthomonadaceae bacterium]
MIRRKKEVTQKVESAVAKAVNYEVTIADIAQRSARRAWVVAFCSLIVSLTLIGGYFYMLPLKEKVPYLIMADAYTGTASVASLRGNFSENNSITANEAINRSNVAHYVMARESYDADLTGLSDWTAVHAMSSPEVAAGYVNTLRGNSSENVARQMGKSRALRVTISSIILQGGGQGRAPTGATIRFQRRIYEKKDGVTHFYDSRIATMAFTYKSNLKMDERSRIANPLGFQVTSYAVTTDNASPVPAELTGQEAEAALSMQQQVDAAVPVDGAADPAAVAVPPPPR